MLLSIKSYLSYHFSPSAVVVEVKENDISRPEQAKVPHNDRNPELAVVTLQPYHERKQQTSTKKNIISRKTKDDINFTTKFAVIMTVITLVLMFVVSIVFSGSASTITGTELHHLSSSLSSSLKKSSSKARRFLGSSSSSSTSSTATQATDQQSTDYSKYSCNYIYHKTPIAGSDEQCAFARTCNGYDGVWAPFVFCYTSTETFRIMLLILLSPFIIGWMVVLFRLLGSTAEDYFSPSLEMFSVKCRLPPRFAGVTLLALGNGAADVSATIASITSDPAQGYLLSLGALTGAAMFISVVISAAVILVASNTDGSGGLQCRGAFTRDVIALLITVVVVYAQLSGGTIGQDGITSFLTLYCVFVCTVLFADVYHRAIVIPRIELYAIEQERNRQILDGQRFHSNNSNNNTTTTTTAIMMMEQTVTENTTVVEGSPNISTSQQSQTITTTESASDQTQDQDMSQQSSNLPANITNFGEVPTDAGVQRQSVIGSHPVSPIPSRVVGLAGKLITALSNYDAATTTAAAIAAAENASGIVRFDDPSRSGWGIESETLPVGGGTTALGTTTTTTGGARAADPPIILHGANGILNRHGQGHGHHPHCSTSGGTGGDDDDDEEDANEYSMLSDPGDNLCVDSATGTGTNQHRHHPSHILIADSWYEAIVDGYEELKQHGRNVYEDIVDSDDLHAIQKALLICELPFTACRQLTVPIPCDGFYVRSVTAASLVISPLWFAYYLSNSHEYNLWSHHPYIMISVQLISIVLSLLMLRYGPPTTIDGLCPMPLYASVPIALYGFIIAATWIDTIADSLVSLLNFIGIVLYIPGPVIGLTVLAWGNSMGDLSANITMAKKGLANMAITACFAGPVFNILVGLGLGFSSLAATTGTVSTAVTLSWSITAGFLFLAINACCILYTGLVYGNGFIPFQYGYVALLIYSVYVITSISLQYKEDADANDNSE